MEGSVTLETERLLLRPVEAGDAEDIFEYRSDKETNRYQGWIPDKTGDVHDFISRLSPVIDRAGTWFQFAVTLTENGSLIGDVGVHFSDEGDRHVEIGCTLNKKYQRRGFATEALSGVIDYLFTGLGKHRVVASIDPQNYASIALVERLGFGREAYSDRDLLADSRWIDDVIYAMHRRDWDIAARQI